MATIYIVEDDINIREIERYALKNSGYEVEEFEGSASFFKRLEKNIPSLILLDIMLPGMNGFEIVQKMRANKIETPTLLLSALDEIPDKVKGLNVGADDYMTKPFSAAELVARINALTRRKGEVIVHELKYEDLSLQLDTCELYCASQHIHLGYKEFEIMKQFMSHPEMITSKDDLIISVWGSESDAMDNNVEVYISFLRKKLKFLKSQVSIKVIRKVGYRLEVCDA